MAWVAVDKNGQEVIFEDQPIKGKEIWYLDREDYYVNLPKGSIKKLIGRELTWDDEPVELV